MNIRRQSGNLQFEEDVFSKNAEYINKIYHEVLILLKFLQTKPQVKNMNILYYYILYYTLIKKRGEKENINGKEYEIGNDYISLDSFIIPNHKIKVAKNENSDKTFQRN